MPTRIYRIIHIDNLPHILEQGGIWCGNEMIRQSLPYVSVGDPALTRKRSSKSVVVAAGGTLNDYVPFYFCPRPVMLYNIWRKTANTYGGGQEPIVHLVTDVERVRSEGKPCFFTKQNAYMEYAEQIDDFDRIAELDWKTLRSETWNNTPDDNKRRERKMAEFLVHRFVPWSCFVGIGVYSERYREEALAMLKGIETTARVEIVAKWYYS